MTRGLPTDAFRKNVLRDAKLTAKLEARREELVDWIDLAKVEISPVFSNVLFACRKHHVRALPAVVDQDLYGA